MHDGALGFYQRIEVEVLHPLVKALATLGPEACAADALAGGTAAATARARNLASARIKAKVGQDPSASRHIDAAHRGPLGHHTPPLVLPPAGPGAKHAEAFVPLSHGAPSEAASGGGGGGSFAAEKAGAAGATVPSLLRLPAVGVGTCWLSPDETYATVKAALGAGARHVDTAEAYRNEAQVTARASNYESTQRSAGDCTRIKLQINTTKHR